MWPIQLVFNHFIVRKKFLPSMTLRNALSFTRSAQLISPRPSASTAIWFSSFRPWVCGQTFYMGKHLLAELLLKNPDLSYCWHGGSNCSLCKGALQGEYSTFLSCGDPWKQQGADFRYNVSTIWPCQTPHFARDCLRIPKAFGQITMYFYFSHLTYDTV